MNLFPASRNVRLGLAAALVLAVLAFWRLDSYRLLLERQEDLIAWAQSGSPSAFRDDFAAPDYHDQWGHTPADIVLLARASRATHPNLPINPGPRNVTRDGDHAVIVQTLTVLNAGGDVTDQEFHFTWHKQNIWPWSWKLREVAAPGLNY